MLMGELPVIRSSPICLPKTDIQSQIVPTLEKQTY